MHTLESGEINARNCDRPGTAPNVYAPCRDDGIDDGIAYKRTFHAEIVTLDRYGEEERLAMPPPRDLSCATQFSCEGPWDHACVHAWLPDARKLFPELVPNLGIARVFAHDLFKRHVQPFKNDSC